MYWVFLYADTFIWQNNNEYLIYNSKNGNWMKGECVGHLKEIINGLCDIINLYCINVEDRVCNDDNYVRAFLIELQNKQCGGYKISTSNLIDRPLSFPPVPNVQSEISRRQDVLNFEYISYINHVDIYYSKMIDNSQLAYSLDAFMRSKPSVNVYLSSFGNVEIGLLQDLLKIISANNFHISLALTYNDFLQNLSFLDEISSLIKSICITTNNCTQEMLDFLTDSPFYDRITITYEISQMDAYKEIVKMRSQTKSTFPVRYNFMLSDKESAFQLISFEKEDVLNRKLSKVAIFRHMLINNNFFGRLKVKENGDITSPCKEVVLSNIGREKCWHEASKNECERSDSEWFLTRSSADPVCNNCLLNCLCPSLSEIEIKAGVMTPCLP